MSTRLDSLLDADRLRDCARNDLTQWHRSMAASPMPKHPDCKDECQQAVDYGLWPEHSCSPRCVRFAADNDKPEMECSDENGGAW